MRGVSAEVFDSCQGLMASALMLVAEALGRGSVSAFGGFRGGWAVGGWGWGAGAFRRAWGGGGGGVHSGFNVWRLG